MGDAMKIKTKCLSILLACSFFSVYGMEEGDELHCSENESAANSQIQELAYVYQPNLKTRLSLKILALIESGKLSKEKVVALPEGLVSYIQCLHSVESYFVTSENASEYEIVLIKEVKELFYQLIELKPECIDAIIGMMDELFDSYIHDGQIYYMIINSTKIEKLFELVKVFLRALLNPEKKIKILQDFCAAHSDISASHGYKAALAILFYCFIRKNAVCMMQFMLDLDLLNRDELLKIFEESCSLHCSARMLRLLNTKIGITKNDLASMLNKENNILVCSINGHADIVEYILELMRHFDLAVPEIINRRYQNSNPILIEATRMGYDDIVELLLRNGADVSIQDNNNCSALFYARQSLENADFSSYHFSSEEERQEYINDQFNRINHMIELLEKVSSRDNI